MTTLELHPEFLTKNGERECAVLAYKEFLALEEWIDDVQDLIEIREGRRTDPELPNIILDDVEREFGIH